MSGDAATAASFASSWTTVRDPSVYTRAQFEDWIAPWQPADLAGAAVLELGCGSGALLDHVADCGPARLVGVDLGESVRTARALLGDRAEVVQADLTAAAPLVERLGRFGRVYCVGVIHHLRDPAAGVDALIELTEPGGQFHGWVYGHEGNALVRHAVDPLRRLACRLPWFVNKYGVALPLSVPFYAYSQACRRLARRGLGAGLPLYDYMRWIGEREFWFHHHVAFDQLVTPQTRYFREREVRAWLDDPRVEPGTGYVVQRNGNGWKFGARRRAA